MPQLQPTLSSGAPQQSAFREMRKPSNISCEASPLSFFEPLIPVGLSLFSVEGEQEDEASPADAFYGFSSLQIDVVMPACVCELSVSRLTAHACMPDSAIFCNNAPHGRGEENGLLTPAGSKGGRWTPERMGTSELPLIKRAQWLRRREKAEGATGKTLRQAGKNLKGASRRSRLLGSFPSAPIYFTTSQTISRSGCLACVISPSIWMHAPL